MNNNSIFFSVIIPLFNKEKFIKNTLNSVFNQSYQNFEIVIVNDGSTDESLSIVEAVNSNKIRLINQFNQGVSIARNSGVNLSKGNYITFLDADDYWYSNHLQNFVDSINKFKKESIFCNNYEIETIKNNIKPTNFSFKNKNENIFLIENYFNASLYNSIAWTSSICLEKKVFENGFWFDEEIKSSQDTDLWVRLGINYSFVFNKNVSARHLKYVQNSLSKTKNLKSRTKTLTKYSEEEKNNESLKKFLDNNRFSVAVQAKLSNEKEIFKDLKENINYQNLNYKQKTILKLPKAAIIWLKKIKTLLAKLQIHTTVFK